MGTKVTHISNPNNNIRFLFINQSYFFKFPAKILLFSDIAKLFKRLYSIEHEQQLYISTLYDFCTDYFRIGDSAILHIHPSYCQLFATYLPPISIGISSEPDRNLIGTSPNDYPIIKPPSLSLKQLSFNVIIQPCRHRRFTFRVWHALVSAGFAQGSTVFRCPRFALHRVTQDNACLS